MKKKFTGSDNPFPVSWAKRKGSPAAKKALIEKQFCHVKKFFRFLIQIILQYHSQINVLLHSKHENLLLILMLFSLSQFSNDFLCMQKKLEYLVDIKRKYGCFTLDFRASVKKIHENSPLVSGSFKKRKHGHYPRNGQFVSIKVKLEASHESLCVLVSQYLNFVDFCSVPHQLPWQFRWANSFPFTYIYSYVKCI